MSVEITDIISQASGKTTNNQWAEFLSSGLPARKNEEYKFTPLSKALEKSFSGNEFAGTEISTFPNVNILVNSPIRLTFYNGRLITSPPSGNGLEVKDLSEIPNDKRFKPDWNDEFHKMNQGLDVDGVYFILAKNTTLESPIYIQHIIDRSAAQSVALARNYIHAQENSELTIVEELIYLGDNPSFDNIETHVIVDRAARVKSYKLQLDGEKQLHVGNTFVQQERDSYHKNVTISMQGQMLRNNLQIFLNDEHCESHLYGLYMLTGKDHVDNHSTVDHKEPNSYSNELYKGILTEQSTGVFNGKIYVRPDAQNTNAFQSNNNLLLSDQATLHTKPQLEIWADDVKCSHGCTSGQIDKEALFYLRSRGLNLEQARALMLKAFVSDILNEISIKEIRDLVETKVDGILFES